MADQHFINIQEFQPEDRQRCLIKTDDGELHDTVYFEDGESKYTYKDKTVLEWLPLEA